MGIVAGRSTRSLGIMNTDVPQTLFQIAGIGLASVIFCTAVLKRTLSPDSDVFGEIFTRPFFGGPFQLQGRYFIPWVRSPEFLGEESVWVQLLFWGARLGGMLVAVGLIGFLASETYIGTIGQS
jgi:hypothetical protein